MIFVVDSSDGDRVTEAGKELGEMLQNEELRAASVLVFANKQDVAGALPVAEVTQRMGLSSGATLKHRRWHVQPASAVTGDGVFDGLSWITA